MRDIKPTTLKTKRAICLLMVIEILYMVLAFFGLGLTGYSWFLRNPKRIPVPGNNILSPADGKISRIIRTTKKYVTLQKGWGTIKTLTSDVDKDCYLINIVMNITNVHYQRAPVAGRVVYTKHLSGNLINAVKNAKNLKACLQNEKNEMLFDTKFGRIKIIQIAGYIARRIECFVRKNDFVTKGHTIGLIKMGSQVTIIIPAKYPLRVKEGQKVKAGKTILVKK